MQKLLQLINKIDLPKYLFAAILIIVPLFPKFPLINIPGTYVAIRFEDLLLFILAVITAVRIITDSKILWKDKIFRSFLIFFIVGFVSLISGVFLSQTVELKLGILHWLRRIEYAIPFFAALTLLKKEKIGEYLQFFVKILLIVVGIAFIYGLGQRYLRFPIIITQNQEYSKGVALFWTPGSHINSTFAGHYDLAAYMVLVLPILLAAMVVVKDKFSKLAILAGSASGLWLLINSLSRIAQVSYLVAIFVTFLLLKKFKAMAVTIIISLIFILMSSGLEARFQRIFDVIQKDFTTHAADITVPVRVAYTPTPTPISVFEDRSTSIRLYVEWPRALRAVEKNPLLGTGYSSISLATDNDYLRTLGEVGILGFFAFCLIFIHISRDFIKIFPFHNNPNLKTAFYVGIIGGTVGIFVVCLFIDLFEASKFATIFWLLLGFAVFMARNNKDE